MNLLERVRQTRTLEGDHPVYQNATINLMAVTAAEVNPTALYVLLPQLRSLYELANRMAARGIDIFNLEEVVEDGIVIGPPLIEKTDGVWAIIDGMHRFTIARKENISVKTITVDGADPNLPVVSFPVQWCDVKEYEVRPNDPTLLRKLRPGVADTSGSLREHYRDLCYLGSLGRRPREGQHG